MAAHLTARRLVGLALGALLLLLVVRGLGVEAGTGQHLALALLPLLLLAGYPLLVAAGLLRDRVLVLLAVAVVAGHLLVVAPALRADPVPDGAQQAPRLRVVVANAYVLNPDPERLGRVLRALRPDVVVVPELTAPGLDGLRASGLLEELPFAAVDPAGRVETVGLLSRLPLTDTGVRRVGTRALVRGTVVVGGVPVRVVPVHPLPAVGAWEPLWRDALDDLRDDVAATRLPLVVAGDLNADRDSAPFRALLHAGLRDAADATGQGLARTFPAGLPLVHLDHVLVRDGAGARLVPLRHALVELPGSDHRGVVVDVAVLPR